MVKKIHYCWFGGNAISESAIECINSWKKFFPDYEIIEWNEFNYDVNCCAYSREAYEAKKWAFVSDLARFKILYEYGGLYFDTDVEVIKSFDDIVTAGSFMGCEKNFVNPGVGIGYEYNKESANFLKEIISFYDSIHFLLEDGSFNQKTIVEYTTDLLKKHGYVENGMQQQVCGMTIYPSDVLCPFDPETGILSISNNTVSIHRYDSSWYGEREKYISKKKTVFCRLMGKHVGIALAVFIGTIKYDGWKVAFSKIGKRIKKA